MTWAIVSVQIQSVVNEQGGRCPWRRLRVAMTSAAAAAAVGFIARWFNVFTMLANVYFFVDPAPPFVCAGWTKTRDDPILKMYNEVCMRYNTTPCDISYVT